MAKKKQTSTTKSSQSAKPAENKLAKNHNVLIGALAIGVVILLVLLFQGQTTISEQRATITQQQQQISELEGEVEKLNDVSVESIIDDAGELIIEKGLDLIEEVITPE